MNILNNENSLASTIQFGFAHPRLLANTGYVPLQGATLRKMVKRLDDAPYNMDDWGFEAAADALFEFSSSDFY